MAKKQITNELMEKLVSMCKRRSLSSPAVKYMEA
jgi:hypothetical protein